MQIDSTNIDWRWIGIQIYAQIDHFLRNYVHSVRTLSRQEDLFNFAPIVLFYICNLSYSFRCVAFMETRAGFCEKGLTTLITFDHNKNRQICTIPRSTIESMTLYDIIMILFLFPNAYLARPSIIFSFGSTQLNYLSFKYVPQTSRYLDKVS